MTTPNGVRWGRDYKVTISTDQGAEVIIKPPMQIRFRIDNYPGGNNVDVAEITVFGLKRETIDMLLSSHETSKGDRQNDYTNIKIEAGYEGDIGQIMDATIITTSMSRQAPNQYITFHCRGFNQQQENAYIVRGWPANTPYADIVRDIAAAYGLPVRVLGNLDLGRALKGYAVQGSAKVELNKLRDTLVGKQGLYALRGFEWSIYNGVVVIKALGGSAPDAPIEVSATTGMIGMPKIGLNFITVETLLDPNFIVHQRINLIAQSRIYSGSELSSINPSNIDPNAGSGEYQIFSVSHSGDFYGGEWKTSLEVQRPR
ncbi:hypothetical protein R84981_002902 [Carnimonas sp. R-84981]|uniref:baseplate hub protein n=1 Tax=Carnimonas bestiolae TaxID=3402172 RepID=UPI003EDB6DBA